MKAVIMAGGEGSRLRPLTSLLPKPMVPIVNQPVMEHILGLVKHHGIDEVVATLAFMPHVIQDYFGDGDEWGMRIDYAVEETPLGTAGSVKNAANFLPDDEPFLVISGDALTDINLREVIEFHQRSGAAVTIALKSVDDPLDFGVVVTAEDGRIERFLEKPTWGQVFSDQINTGIYVIEPWVLDEIPDGPYDFSGELFPKLMELGHPLYGFAASGYWCDVGSLDSYVEAHRDILDGKTMVFIPGVHAKGDVWVAESATVEPGAVLGDKVVIGANAKVRAGAVVGDYTVIGTNCLIGTDVRVNHSVLWDDTFIGEQSIVSGAVLCRHVDVRARAVLDVGVVVGNESVVGPGAHLTADVQIFPYKRIEASAMVTSSLIWESTAPRTLFVDGSVVGLVAIDITPEVGLKVAEAFGTTLPKSGHVVISRDNSKASRMIKRAMVAGLNAAGINVRDLRVTSPAVSRFTAQKTRCVGGIHVAGSGQDPQSLEIRFFDKNGLDLSASEQKKVERLYFRGEFRRAFFDEVGEIIYPPRPLEYYTAALQEIVESAGLPQGWRKVVVDMGCGAASLSLPLVAQRWHLNVVALNPVVDIDSGGDCGDPSEEAVDQLSRSVEMFGADFGVSFERGAERIRLMTPSGRMLDGDATLHVLLEMWCRSMASIPGAVAVPLVASQITERIAAEHGRVLIRPGRTRRAMAEAVTDGRATFAGSPSGGFIFSEVLPAYDGVLAVGVLARLIDACAESLDEIVDGLPECHKVELDVFCPVDRKGSVMRQVTEASAGMDTDLTEGVRIRSDDGWALVLPDSNEARVTIWAESSSDQKARTLAERWRAVVETGIARA